MKRRSKLFGMAGAVALAGAAGCSGDTENANGPVGGAGTGGAAGGDAAIAESGPDTTSGDAAGEGATCPVTVVPSPGVAVTDRGAVRGVKDGTTWSYLGIPYATPPLGDLRWKPPIEHACWSDVRDATAYGDACPQIDTTSKQPKGKEDCLTLNIWAPEQAAASALLPVLFFIHGGGNIQGSANEPLPGGKPIYNGRRLAEAGPVVVVTIQYRLGPLGFLALPELAAESPHHASGNYGSLDQVAALQWVRRNIGALGGDPNRVMVFGESAGGVDTCTMVASPLAKGLFHRALIESGGCFQPAYAATEAAMSDRVNKSSSCGSAADRLACLRAKSPEELLAEIPGSITAFEPTVGTSATQYGPVVDGWVLLESPYDALKHGTHNHVPFAIGTNAEEVAALITVQIKTEADYKATVTSAFQSLGQNVVDLVLQTYPVSDYASPQDALVAVFSDMRFTCPTRRIARAADTGQDESVYRYFFSRRAKTPTGDKAAAHAIELLYVFGTLRDIATFTPDPVDTTLSDTIAGYWSRFGTTGDPNGGGAPAWPVYDSAADRTLVLDSPIAPIDGVRTKQCDMWETLAP